MDIEKLKELKAEFEQMRKYNDRHCMSTATEDDVLDVLDEAITNQVVAESATSEDVGMVIKLIQAYGKNNASKCQIEGTIFYDTGSPCTRHRFEEDTIDIIITALQAYQPWIPVSNPPTEFGDYLVLVKYYKGAKQIKIDVAEWYDEWKINYEWTITHWKSLPEPPKGE